MGINFPSSSLVSRIIIHHGPEAKHASNRIDITADIRPDFNADINPERTKENISQRLYRMTQNVINRVALYNKIPHTIPITSNGVFVEEVAQRIRERVYLKDDAEGAQLLKELAAEWANRIRTGQEPIIHLAVNASGDIEVVIDQGTIDRAPKLRADRRPLIK